LLHGGVMTSVGLACAWTNRAGVWAFCTRSDKKNATATAEWKPFTLGNLGTALAWYRMQEILRRCHNYGTLRKEDSPAAKAAVKAVEDAVGKELVVDLVTNQGIVDEVVRKHKVDVSTCTMKEVISFDNSHNSKIGLKKKGQELKDVVTARICTVLGERPTPKGAQRRWPGSSQRRARMQTTARWCR
jgi:hypothetical protein